MAGAKDTTDKNNNDCPPNTSNYKTKKTKNSKLPKKKNTKSLKAGLEFPVSRILRYLKQYCNKSPVSAGAAVYLAGVLEYLMVDILDFSGSAAIDNKRSRISPRHILLAIKNDDALSELLSNVTIAYGGVKPNIHKELVMKNKK